jgi:hypothetical protein
MASRMITDRNGDLNVFNLNWNGDELKLNGNNAEPENRWNPDNKFVFRFRKSILFRVYKSRFFFSGFFRLFFHPPSILPISSSFSDNSAYCLWDINFASHEM